MVSGDPSDPMNVQDLERVHATGFDLEDVKVTFNHDVKIKVSDVDVEGKQGEILNIPRWVAKVVIIMIAIRGVVGANNKPRLT